MHLDIDGMCIPINERQFIFDGKRQHFMNVSSGKCQKGHNLNTMFSLARIEFVSVLLN